MILSDDEKKINALQEINTILKGNGTALKNFEGMPLLSDQHTDNTNVLIVDEKTHDREDLKKKHQEWLEMLTDEQKAIYEDIIEAVDNDLGGVFFVYGFG